MRRGFFRACFIGPWWLRATAGPSLALSGLAGWQGKRFVDEGTATNVLQTRQGRIEKLRMQCRAAASPVDGRPGVTLNYGRSEEHTSELQSRENLVCRLLLEKKKGDVA